MSLALRRWWPAALWTAIIFLLSSRPSLPIGFTSGLDKVAHFTEYLLLGILIGHGLFRTDGFTGWAVLFGVLIGALDEVYQSTVPGRTPDWADWTVDAMGVTVGIFVYAPLRQWWENRLPSRRSANQ